MEQAVRTVADTLAADMPTVGAAAVGDTVAAVTVVADMEAGAKCFVSSPFQPPVRNGRALTFMTDRSGAPEDWSMAAAIPSGYRTRRRPDRSNRN